MITTDDFLAHYGVKGMKWGIRKARDIKASHDGKEANRILDKAKKDGVRSLTSHELRVINTRRELETKFEKQNPKPKDLSDHGKEFAKTLAKEAAAAAGIGSTAAFVKYVSSGKAQEHLKLGMSFVKNNPYLKIGVKSLPEFEQLKLF